MVYEDADVEEMLPSSLGRILWKGFVPSAKRKACVKHSTRVTDEVAHLVLENHAVCVQKCDGHGEKHGQEGEDMVAQEFV